MTVVSANLVDQGKLTGDSIFLEYANGRNSTRPLAEVCCCVKDFCVKKIVAVESGFDNKVLLGLDMGYSVLINLFACVQVTPTFVLETRLQERKRRQREEEAAKKQVQECAVAIPVPLFQMRDRKSVV